MAGGQPLEHGSRLEDLDGLLRPDEPDPGAAVALVLDQPLVLEAGQRGTDGRAPDAELCVRSVSTRRSLG